MTQLQLEQQLFQLENLLIKQKPLNPDGSHNRVYYSLKGKIAKLKKRKSSEWDKFLAL